MTAAHCIEEKEHEWESKFKKEYKTNPHIYEVHYAADQYGKWKKAKMKMCYTRPKHWKKGKESGVYDVGLCKIEGRFELNPKNAWPICLPWPKVDKRIQVGDKVSVVGWGLMEDKSGNKPGGKLPTHLQGVTVTVKEIQDDGKIIYDNLPCSVS